MKLIVFIAFFFVFLTLPLASFARIGVGVATGKIQVREKLKPGIIYNLPPLTVVNTGDVASDYEVTITYFETQEQKKPANEWFIFTPQRFYLKPGESKVVDIKVNLPIMVSPGDYFGFIEAHPIKKSVSGQTSVGIAAATKLYFTVIPANIFSAIFYKAVSFWNVYSPWPQIFLGLMILTGIAGFVKKYVNIQIGIKHAPQEGKPEATVKEDVLPTTASGQKPKPKRRKKISNE